MFRAVVAALAVVFSLSAAAPLLAQGAPPQGGADQPYTVEYYYKVQWGHQAGIPRSLPEKSLPAVEAHCGDRAHALGED